MVPERTAIRRNAVHFGVLVAILIGGSVLVTSVSQAVTPPASAYLRGILLVGLVCVGLGRTLWATDDEGRRASIAAGLGGGVGAIVAITYLDGQVQQAVGAGLGAMVLSVGVILWMGLRES
jgi:peptidoglycan/LPS O-acetylase OafA/YrhL